MTDRQPEVPELDQAKLEAAKAKVEAFVAQCSAYAEQFKQGELDASIELTDPYITPNLGSPIVIDDQPPAAPTAPSPKQGITDTEIKHGKATELFTGTKIDLDKVWTTKPPPAVKEAIEAQDLADPPPWTWSDPSMLAKMERYLNTLKEDAATTAAEDPEMVPVPVNAPGECLRDRHRSMAKNARRLLIKKNRDYGGTFDPYRNFRAAELLGVAAGTGILIRMLDKIARLQTYIANDCAGLEVDDESAYDTLIDIINYAVLLGGLLDINPTDV